VNGGATLVSQFDNLYTPTGSIRQWTHNQPADTVNPVTTWGIEQDDADQLTGVTVSSGNATVRREAYTYDRAGNRLSQQSGNVVRTATFNQLNQITAQTPGGRMRFSGNTTEAADVTVQGRPAQMVDSTHFTAEADVAAGDNDITVTARDGSGNLQTKGWRVTVPGGSNRTFTHDVNGNLLSDGVRTYAWDAKNQPTTVSQNGTDYQFVYDGFGRRVGEKVNGTMTRRWVWDGLTIAVFAVLREQSSPDATRQIDIRYLGFATYTSFAAICGFFAGRLYQARTSRVRRGGDGSRLL